MADLIDQTYAEAALAGLGLSAAQLSHLPAAITAASAAIERFCGRSFARADHDQVYVPAIDGCVILDQYPVNAVSRVSAGRVPALTVRNPDTSTNQRATVAFDYPAGDDLETGLVATGLKLVRVASAVTTTTTLAFATYPTLTALSVAVSAAGGGWEAEVLGGYGAWPSAELVGGESARGCLGGGASLDVFGEDLDGLGYTLQRRVGILRLRAGQAGESRIWPDDGPGEGEWGDVRVVYDAGYETIPADLQDACAEAVKAILTGLVVDRNLTSERAGQYAYTIDPSGAAVRLPENVLRAIAPYRDVRA